MSTISNGQIAFVSIIAAVGFGTVAAVLLLLARQEARESHQTYLGLRVDVTNADGVTESSINTSMIGPTILVGTTKVHVWPVFNGPRIEVRP